MATVSNGMKHQDRDMVPKKIVIAMFSVMIITLGLVVFAKVNDVPMSAVYQETPSIKEMSVQFVSSREGVSTVYDMDGNRIAASGDEMMGFIGVIGIVVRRNRLNAGLPNDTPVVIRQRETGTYGIYDPATGWSMELIGYGADNVAAFAKLLD